MQFEWDEAKRKSNLKTHGLDFADAELVFGGLTASYEDDRFHYDEQRFVTLGLPTRRSGLDCPYRGAGRHSCNFLSSGNTS